LRRDAVKISVADRRTKFKINREIEKFSNSSKNEKKSKIEIESL